MLWHQPVMEEGSKPNNFAWWIYVSIFVLGFVLYCLVMFLLNYDGTSNSSLMLILNLIVAPLFLAISCPFFLYSYYSSLMVNYRYRVEFIKSKKQLWENWIQQSLNIINYSYVSHTQNNAIKILGLDGKAELNANQSLQINYLDDQNSPKLNNILDELLKSFVKELQKSSSTIIVDIYTPSLSEEVKSALSIFCQQNNITLADKQINFLSSIPDLDAVDKWETDKQNLHLLILLSLHTDSIVVNSEFAIALLFRHNDSSQSRVATKIYRPFKTDLTILSEEFPLLINSNQIEKESLHHVWTINLSDSAINTIQTKITANRSHFDIKNIHRLEQYEGKIDKTHGWLAVTYACQAIEHGQKGQLVALYDEDKVSFLQIEKRSKRIKDNKIEKINDFPFTYLVSVILLLLAICFLPHDVEVKKLMGCSILGGSFFFALLLSIFIPFKRKLLIKKMEQEWDLLRRENSE